jgi:sulfatase maturation enzyme AslB (radical SAM superfamily)
MIKTRLFPESNYKSIYFNGKTIRLYLDSKKPITELEYPEFYDIKLTGKCNANCSYCYQSSKQSDCDYEAIEKLTKFFSTMTENQKPYQIAFGGGEPTLHYQFHDIMRVTREFGISPNYTTNGMFIEEDCVDKIIETTKKYCEGVAVTCHKHLEKYWRKCVDRLVNEGIFTNFHNLIGDNNSVDDFIKIYNEYFGKVKYFVVLPLLNEGRAKNISNQNSDNYTYFFEKIYEIKAKKGNINDIAFGANFYPYLKDKKDLGIDTYEPEIMSKYLDLKDMALYKSSFNTEKPIKYIKF